MADDLGTANLRETPVAKWLGGKLERTFRVTRSFWGEANSMKG